jgi:hypothetical protein
MKNVTPDISEEQRQLLQNLDLTKIKLAIEYITTNSRLTVSQQSTIINEPWRVNYRVEPPTPENFLTHKYIGPMADSIYPRVRKWFIDFFDETSMYRHAVLYPFISAGKSTLSVLINLYIVTHLCLMRNPKKFIGVAPHMNLAFVLCSYNLTKSAEILLEPLLNVLEGSEFFTKVRTQEDMIKRERSFQSEENVSNIYWTTASRNGVYAIQLSNGINFKLASAPKDLLGLSQPLDEPIKLPNGSYTTMGDIKVGDKISSPSEETTTVVGVFPQGKQPCYQITLEDGRSTRCSPNHLWKVKYRKDSNEVFRTEIINLQFMLDRPDWEFFVYDVEDCEV